MARFDVYRADAGYLLDCQSDFFEHLSTRFVVPLTDPDDAPPIDRKLNPAFMVDGRTLVMRTQWASTLMRGELGTRIASLADDDIIINALDRLITGV